MRGGALQRHGAGTRAGTEPIPRHREWTVHHTNILLEMLYIKSGRWQHGHSESAQR